MAKKQIQDLVDGNESTIISNQVNLDTDGTTVIDMEREGTHPSQTHELQSLSESTVLDDGATIKETLLVESETGLVEILEGYDDGYVRIKLPVTTVDVSNRNGRTYPRELAVAECGMEFEGRILGQSKHPEHEPDLLDQFIVWEKSVLEGDMQSFIAKIIPTQRGKDFTEIARAKAKVSTSRRGTGELKEGKDKLGAKTKVIIPGKYTLHGIDIIYPGFQSDRSAQQTIHFESVQSNTETSVNEKVVTPMPEKQTAPVVQPTTPELEASTSAVTPSPDEQATPVVEAAVAQPNTPLPTELIERLTGEIQAKDTLIAQKNVTISDLSSKHAEDETQIRAMTETFTVLNAEIVKLENAVNELNGTVQERTRLVATRDETLARRNQEVSERQKLLAQAHETLAERDGAIAERNQMVMERNKIITERDQMITKLSKDLSARNDVVAQQDSLIQERDAVIAERNKTIATQHTALVERDAMVTQQDKELVERDAELLKLSDQLLTEKLNVEHAKQKNEAFQYLFERVQLDGEKASWLIFNELRECATVEGVEAKFNASKQKNLALIEGVARIAGKAVYGDENVDANPKPEEETKKDTPKLTRQAVHTARAFGLPINPQN